MVRRKSRRVREPSSLHPPVQFNLKYILSHAFVGRRARLLARFHIGSTDLCVQFCIHILTILMRATQNTHTQKWSPNLRKANKPKYAPRTLAGGSQHFPVLPRLAFVKERKSERDHGAIASSSW